MRLSTKGRYSLEALVMLGFLSQGMHANISLKHISQETEISEGYLEQLFNKLKKSEILISKRGKDGGYQLAKPPSDITIGSIFRSVEGSLSPVKCLDTDCCDRSEFCLTRCFWTEINDEINQVIDTLVLSELIETYRKNLAIGDKS
ncbi:MAG: Rrf2 family transcriptional regulator [Clostridiales bacterium]|nr:Rrf2 family transcriptional regulator [Clostridiales bacterium]